MGFYLVPHDFTNWIPIPAILVVGIVMDIIGARKARFGVSGWWRIDNVSHLGGYASGIIAALAIKHRARQQKGADGMEEKSMKTMDILEPGQM